MPHTQLENSRTATSPPFLEKTKSVIALISSTDQRVAERSHYNGIIKNQLGAEKISHFVMSVA